MSEEMHAGGCLCGAVRFRARGAPRRVGLCHCETCRKNTGAPFAGYAIYDPAAVEVSGGRTGRYRTSAAMTHHFCPECGSPVFSMDAAAGEINLHLGAFDAPDSLPPSYELWCVRRLGWLPALPGVAAHDRDRP